MGGCSSLHKNSGSSTMRIRLSMASKTKPPLIPAPTKDNIITSTNGEYPLSVFKSQASATPPVTGFRSFGSKEETFFDSQAWLDSDCDEDFLSVNGDFTPSWGNTPSRGNTPNHQSSFRGTPIRQSSFSGTQLNKSPFMDRAPDLKVEPSPRKKRLSELFSESVEVDEQPNNQNRTNGKPEVKPPKLDVQPKSTSETPYVSGTNSVCSSERTPSRELKPEKVKVSRTGQCCLPRFTPSRKSGEKKMLSPEKYTMG